MYARLMPSDPVVASREIERLLRGGPRTSFDPDWFRFGDVVVSPETVVAILEPHLTERRLDRIEDVLDHRTYSLAVVVDGMVDTGNVSAMMRTADAFGVQPFHAIDTAGSYKHSRRTSQGAEKWLDRYRWRSVDDCVNSLRTAGYRIVAAHPDEAAKPISEVGFGDSTALVFGNELEGISPDLLAAADVITAIPMSGFVRSFNISVAAGVCLNAAREDRIERLGRHGDLNPDDRARLGAVFVMKSVRHAEALIQHSLDAGQGVSGAT